MIQCHHRKNEPAHSFVERHGLWSDEQFEAAAKADRWIEEHGLEVVRLSFPDQHGILRGKTVIASEAARVMRNGCAITTTLLAKDTSHKTVFPVFTAGGGFGMAEMEGAGDFLMIADPDHVPCAAVGATDRLDAVRHVFRRREAGAVLDPPSLSARAAKLADAGFDYLAGLEVEFHVFKLDNPRLDAGRRHLARRGAGRQPDLAGLPVSHRNALRSDRAGAGDACAAR